MNLMLNPLLLVTFFPLVGVLLILLYRKTWTSAIRWTALAVSLVTFGLSLWLLSGCNTADANAQMEINLPWFTMGGNHRFSSRRGRYQHPDGAAHRIPYPAGNLLHLESGQGKGQRLYGLLPAVGSRHDGGICLT